MGSILSYLKSSALAALRKAVSIVTDSAGREEYEEEQKIESTV